MACQLTWRVARRGVLHANCPLPEPPFLSPRCLYGLPMEAHWHGCTLAASLSGYAIPCSGCTDCTVTDEHARADRPGVPSGSQAVSVLRRHRGPSSCAWDSEFKFQWEALGACQCIVTCSLQRIASFLQPLVARIIACQWSVSGYHDGHWSVTVTATSGPSLSASGSGLWSLIMPA